MTPIKKLDDRLPECIQEYLNNFAEKVTYGILLNLKDKSKLSDYLEEEFCYANTYSQAKAWIHVAEKYDLDELANQMKLSLTIYRT